MLEQIKSSFLKKKPKQMQIKESSNLLQYDLTMCVFQKKNNILILSNFRWKGSTNLKEFENKNLMLYTKTFKLLLVPSMIMNSNIFFKIRILKNKTLKSYFKTDLVPFYNTQRILEQINWCYRLTNRKKVIEERRHP